MNLIDAVVTQVLRDPKFNDDYASEGVTWWEIEVEYDAYGRKSVTTLSFKNHEEVEKVKVGYTFLT